MKSTPKGDSSGPVFRPVSRPDRGRPKRPFCISLDDMVKRGFSHSDHGIQTDQIHPGKPVVYRPDPPPRPGIFTGPERNHFGTILEPRFTRRRKASTRPRRTAGIPGIFLGYKSVRSLIRPVFDLVTRYRSSYPTKPRPDASTASRNRF